MSQQATKWITGTKHLTVITSVLETLQSQYLVMQTSHKSLHTVQLERQESQENQDKTKCINLRIPRIESPWPRNAKMYNEQCNHACSTISHDVCHHFLVFSDLSIMQYLKGLFWFKLYWFSPGLFVVFLVFFTEIEYKRSIK